MQRNKIEYLYFGGTSLHAGLYVELVQALNKSGLDVTLVIKNEIPLKNLITYIFTHSEKRTVGPNNIARIKERLQGKIILVPYIKGLSSIGKAVFLICALFVFFRKSCGCDVLVVHAKNVVEYMLCIKNILSWKEIRVIGEFEGDLPSEIEYVMGKNDHNASGSKEQIMVVDAYKRQKWVIEKSSLVICVTEMLKNLICERFSITDTCRFKIYPTFASSKLFYFDEEKRRVMRTRQKVNDRFVVLYCGNLGSKWQAPNLLVKMFERIQGSLKNALFFILTPQSNQAFIRPYLENAHITDYAFAEAEHAEIIDYLCMADCALALREKHIMNEVATPGKFAEYALTGLPIVMTNSIGYYSDVMKVRRDALIIENLEDNELIETQIANFVNNQIPELDRKEFAGWACENFSLEQRIPDLTNVYKSVGGHLDNRNR